jgi:hypothetical protein
MLPRLTVMMWVRTRLPSRQRDGSGNTHSTTSTVTVEDNIDPVAVAQNITVSLDANGTASITTADVDNGSSDNCSYTLALDVTSFDCDDVGANTVTLTATDAVETHIVPQLQLLYKTI